MADKVVQRLNESPSQLALSDTNSTAVQRKCSTCQEEENVQKKEDDLSVGELEIQRKPIFESNAEQPEANVQTKPISALIIQAKCESCEEEGKLQKKEEELPDSELSLQLKSNDTLSENTSSLEGKLNSNKGGGSSLSKGMQTSMGSAFGADFSNVKVHTGSEAVQMNQELNAQAFTHGNDIYFNEGKYDTNSNSGKHLLAHELTHTVQQGVSSIQMSSDTPEAPLNGNTVKEVGKQIDEKPLKVLGYNSLYWLVDYKKLLTYGQLRTSVNLNDVSNYLYGSVNHASALASENNLSITEELPVGTRVIMGSNKTKGFKNTKLSLGHFNSSPRFPAEIVNPGQVLSDMGVPGPGSYDARKENYKQLLIVDFNVIVSKLNEGHYSDSDEEFIIGILKKWAEIKFVGNFNTYKRYKNGGYFLDEMFRKLQGKTIVLGGVFVDQWTNYYDLMFNHFDKISKVKALRNQYSYYYKKDNGNKEISFFDEVVVKTVKGVPGGITAGVGGLIESLPFETAEKFGKFLKTDVAAPYLEAVNYGDKDMIEQAVDGSALAGGLLGEGLQMLRGGPLLKAKAAIDALKKADEIVALKDKVDNLLDLEKHIPKVISWFGDETKLIGIMLGIENDQAISAIENWVNEVVPVPKVKTDEKGAKGIRKLIKKVVDIINKIKKLLKPIFEIRKKLSNYILTIGAIIVSIPEFLKVLEFINKGKKDPKYLNKILKKFTKAFGIKVQELLDGVLKQVQGFLTTIEQLVSDLKITSKEIADVVTNFALKVVGTKVKIVKLASHSSQVKNLVSEHLIDPLFPQGPLKVLNEEFAKLTKKAKPGLIKANEGIVVVHSKISDTIQKEVIPSITKLIIQKKPDEPGVAISEEKDHEITQSITNSKGEKMPKNLQSQMENTFNYDFDHVKIHDNKNADFASKSIQAKAFTTGEDIYFKENKYKPDTTEGNHLLAHELTHVVQQNNGAKKHTLQRAKDDIPTKLTKKIIEQIEDRIRLLKKFGNAKKEAKALTKLSKYLQEHSEGKIEKIEIEKLKDKLGFDLLEVKDKDKLWEISYDYESKGIKKLIQHKRFGKVPSGNSKIDWADIENGVLLDLTNYVNLRGVKLRVNPAFIPKGDKKKRSNKVRCKKGLSPYLNDDIKIELHHNTQNFFSTLDEVSSSHHKFDYDDLHAMANDKGYISWRGEIALYKGEIRTLGYIYNRIRYKHWRERYLAF